MQSKNSSSPPQQAHRARGIVEGQSISAPHSPYSLQTPHTPPLAFTAQATGTPVQQREPISMSPYIEPLQVNYQAVLGRHGSRTLIEVEDSPIKVTCRTKGGVRSPFMAPMPNEPIPEIDRSGRHNPYTFSYSGSSTPMQVSTPTHQPQTSAFENWATPSHMMQSSSPKWGMERPVMDARLTQGHSACLDTTFELPAEVVHRSLKDRCRYIHFPADLPAFPKAGTHGSNANSGNNTTSNGGIGSGGAGEASPPIALFIGQVRFETTAAELLWLVHRTCGACPSHLESRGAGCYLLYCKSEADLTLVRSLHKRVLFDIGGVWLARTANEVDTMCEYIALDAPLISKRARLPRDSMVVEELKMDAVNSSSRRTHGGGGDERQMFRNQRSSSRSFDPKSTHVHDMSQAAGADTLQKPVQQQRQQNRGQTGEPPAYQESAEPYPGQTPSLYGDCPPVQVGARCTSRTEPLS
ncbi:hypothetical protein JKF63_03231 [Porcisia hertigi]|uniref:Uncharacterized protein n=1 Tax=Porcisia hertigi TaxID=2761500 RepID=A0A836IRZ6_9TRYP|nr:hypothetical protein JKF63_03231 [Porcisia hertigi]